MINILLAFTIVITKNSILFYLLHFWTLFFAQIW